MGTVGLSFGSPTSGTGFNVSQTVSQIVSNLENVETPWKNQLSSLESQDTVLSNLGTLFSNLSNDLSSLTDFQGVMSLKEGSTSNPDVLAITSAAASAAAGTYDVSVTSLATTANGYLSPITNASDTLSGAIEINGTTIDVPTASGDDNLQGLANAVTSANIGVTATVLTDANGSRLMLTSNTSGAGGSLNVVTTGTDSSGNALGIIDSSNNNAALSYTSVLATGANAVLAVNGVQLSSASNTVTNLIPGVTFQLLGTTTTGDDVQVVIANDNSDVESAVTQFVNDYNSLISAINTQEANDSSGNPEPLFGSPTLSTLQQQLLSSMNFQNPTGYLDPVSSASDTLTGSITISFNGGLPLNYVNAPSVDGTISSGSLTAPNAGDALSGSISVQVGSGTAESIVIGPVPSSGAAANTIYTGSATGDNTLAGLASAINGAGIGVTASVTGNQLSLSSGTAGALTVSSSIVDTSLQTVNVPTSSGNNTLAGLAGAINSAGIGVTANVVNNGDGPQLVLVPLTQGATISVTSNVTDTTSGSALSYTGGDGGISGLTSLGINMNNDGTISLDETSLDSVLNSNYSGVQAFFQDANSWGLTFTTMLNNSGTSNPDGVLALAHSSNSSVESGLNTELSREEGVISSQQASLTDELNSANEILQELPTQLQGVNELYSAITGYNENQNG